MVHSSFVNSPKLKKKNVNKSQKHFEKMTEGDVGLTLQKEGHKIYFHDYTTHNIT